MGDGLVGIVSIKGEGKQHVCVCVRMQKPNGSCARACRAFVKNDGLTHPMHAPNATTHFLRHPHPRPPPPPPKPHRGPALPAELAGDLPRRRRRRARRGGGVSAAAGGLGGGAGRAGQRGRGAAAAGGGGGSGSRSRRSGSRRSGGSAGGCCGRCWRRERTGGSGMGGGTGGGGREGGGGNGEKGGGLAWRGAKVVYRKQHGNQSRVVSCSAGVVPCRAGICRGVRARVCAGGALELARRTGVGVCIRRLLRWLVRP